jgi:cell division protein FtsQ
MSELEEKSVEEAGLENYWHILAGQRKESDDIRFARERKYIVRRALVISVVFLLVLYFLLPVSHVQMIQVKGLDHLSEDYIVSLSGLSTDSRYYLCFPSSIASKIRSDDMIEDCTVKLKKDNVISITVTEKKAVGYYYDDTDGGMVLLSDGTTAELKSEYLEIIAQVPYISGFSDDELVELAKAMDSVDEDVIAEMSEIDRYSMSYDASTVRIHMRNGGYFLASMDAVDKVNYYNEIYVRMTNTDYCIFGSSSADAAYTSVCPWNGEAEEYWTDSDGNYILNSSGQKAVKHYYTDSEGNAALDASGNKIPIPLDENGDEVVDADFLEHYAAGYYETGTLVLPDES